MAVKLTKKERIKRGESLREQLRVYGNFHINDWCLYLYNNDFINNEELQKLVKENGVLIQSGLF